MDFRRECVVMLLVALLLAGCAWLVPAKYDNAEFGVYADLWQYGQRLEENCGSFQTEVRVKTLMGFSIERAVLFGRFGLYEDSKKYAELMARLVSEFEPGRSLGYCRASAENIRAGVERIMEQLGRRAR